MELHEIKHGVTTPEPYSVSIETVARTALLGMLFDGYRTHFFERAARFRFVNDTPMGRANVQAGEDVDWLDQVCDDAEHMTYVDFAAKYPHLGPYGLLDSSSV